MYATHFTDGFLYGDVMKKRYTLRYNYMHNYFNDYGNLVGGI